mgnify:FL=1
MKWQEIMPVLISIIIIILIAIIGRTSRFIAAITATMPINIALGMWIIYSSSGGDAKSVTEFSLGMLLAVFPSMGVLVAVWLASRAQVKIIPMLLLGYSVWAVGLVLIFGIRKLLGA